MYGDKPVIPVVGNRESTNYCLFRIPLSWCPRTPGANTPSSKTVLSLMNEAGPALILLVVTFPLFAIVIVKVVGLILEGAIDLITGIIAISIALAMFVAMAITKDPVLPWAILVVMGTMIAFYPFAAQQVSDYDHRRINLESLERHYAAWAQRPDNSSAALGLARCLYDRGYRSAAVSLADRMLSAYSTEIDMQTMRSPREMFREEDILLKRWKRSLTTDDSRPIRCSCGNKNPAHVLDCERCGRPHVLEASRRSQNGGRFLGKLILAWALIAGCLVCSAANAAYAPQQWRTPGFIACLAVVGGILAWLFRRPRHDQTVYRPLVDD